jgi:hypothetical protein
VLEQERCHSIQKLILSIMNNYEDCLSPLKRFMKRLDELGRDYSVSGRAFVTRCTAPGHLDNHPSLSFGEHETGKLWLHCHVGCELGSIMKGVSLRLCDIYPYEDQPKRPNHLLNSGLYMLRSYISQEQMDQFSRLSESYANNLQARPRKLTALARLLNVSKSSLKNLHVGWRERNRREMPKNSGNWVDDGPCWTFPMHDGKSQVVNIMRRYVDESVPKRGLQGGRMGLFVPRRWQSMEGPIFLVEGPSDVAALLSINLCALGRPNNRAGADDLADLLRFDSREIFVVGENDRQGGLWPGDPTPFARALSRGLRREVVAFLPPIGSKYIRDYMNNIVRNKGS